MTQTVYRIVPLDSKKKEIKLKSCAYIVGEQQIENLIIVSIKEPFSREVARRMMFHVEKLTSQKCIVVPETVKFCKFKKIGKG